MENKILRNGYVWLIEPSLFYFTVVLGNSIFLRNKYQEAVLKLANEAEKIDIKDKNAMQLLVQERNNLKVMIRKEQNPLLTAIQERKNILEYGNKIGPDLEQLYKTKIIAYPDWTEEEIYTEIMQNTSKSNESVNLQAEVLTYVTYGLVIFLLLRLLLRMSKSKRGESLLNALHVIGIWLGGGLAVLTGFTFGVKLSNYDNMIILPISMGMLCGACFAFIWDKIFKLLFEKLQRDIDAVNKLRP